ELAQRHETALCGYDGPGARSSSGTGSAGSRNPRRAAHDCIDGGLGSSERSSVGLCGPDILVRQVLSCGFGHSCPTLLVFCHLPNTDIVFFPMADVCEV